MEGKKEEIKVGGREGRKKRKKEEIQNIKIFRGRIYVINSFFYFFSGGS